MSGGAGEAANPWRRGLVVFSGQADIWWLKLLRPGFRHCFLALQNETGWVVYEPLSHCTVLTPVAVAQGWDLAAWYRQNGFVVIDALPSIAPRRLAPIRPYSCVEAVKRVLGVQARWVLTPWQLHQFLLNGKNSLTTRTKTDYT